MQYSISRIVAYGCSYTAGTELLDHELDPRADLIKRTQGMDLALFNYLKTLPADTVLYAVVLAVLISPLIYRWRLTVSRWLRRLAWVMLGVFIGLNL